MTKIQMIATLKFAAQNANNQEQWSMTVCDDGYPMVHTPGDIVCHPDQNHEPRDPGDLANLEFIALASPKNILILIDLLDK